MSEEQSTPSSTVYQLPVYTLENAPATTVNTAETDSGSDLKEYIEISVDRESSYVIAEKVEGGRTSTYTFDIDTTDTDLCSYRGGSPEKLPTPVIHALYETGFSLTNYDPVNEWFQVWLEIRLIRGRINSLNFDNEDALANVICDTLKDELGYVDELFGTRSVTGSYEEYNRLENSGKYGVMKHKHPDGTEQAVDPHKRPEVESRNEPRGTVVKRSAPHLLFENVATEYENYELFSLVTDDDLYPPIGVRTHVNENRTQLYVDTITKNHIQRITFDIVDNEYCVYDGELPIDYLSSYVLDAVEEEGYTVKDTINIFANSDKDQLVAACDNKLRTIWRLVHHTNTGKPDSMVDRNIHAARTNLVTLFVAIALNEIMPGRYKKHVKTVSNRDTEDELLANAIHYLMQIHAKSNPEDLKNLATYLPELEYVEETIVGTTMNSVDKVATNIGVVWHAIDDEMYPPKNSGPQF